MAQYGKISKGAIVTGWLVNVLGTIGGTFLFGLGLIYLLRGIGLRPDQIARFLNGSIVKILALILDLLFTMLGGYVAARIARFANIMHAVVTGILYELTGVVLVLMFAPKFDGSLLFDFVAGLLLTVPFAAFGGALHQPRRVFG